MNLSTDTYMKIRKGLKVNTKESIRDNDPSMRYHVYVWVSTYYEGWISHRADFTSERSEAKTFTQFEIRDLLARNAWWTNAEGPVSGKTYYRIDNLPEPS